MSADASSVSIFDMQEKFRRCFIEAYCLCDVDLSTFSLPFARLAGEYTIKYMACSVALSAVPSEIYMETEDPVRRVEVVKNLERLGARHIIVHSFPRNDQEHLANKFMGRVLEQAKQNFRKLYIRGSTNTVPVLQRVEQDYEIWMGTLRQLDGSTGEFSGPRDGEWTEEDRKRCVAAMMAVHEGRPPPQYKGASMVVEESVSPEVALAELECVAGVLDERASEWKRRLEACEARRVLEGEELRAQLVAQQEECEARLVHQETIHAGKMVAKDAEWEARLAAKVLELSGASLSEGVADARLAAMVADCEAQLANRNVEHREQLAARDLAHARTKDILDDKKLQKLQLTLRVEMEDRFSALKRELADERQLCARFRADLAVSAGHVNTLEEEKMSGQWGGYQCDDSDDELGLSMTRMTESERNQKLRCLLAQSAVTRKEAWLARDAEYDMVTALQKKLDDKETEGRIVVDRLKQEIRGLEFLVADERQLRKRAGKGDIFHEEGKVLVKCTKCFQLVDDHAAHVASYHATTNVHLRCVPCPLGCGTVLHPRYTDKTIPQWQLDVHTYSDACKAKLLLVADARRECEVYLRRKEMEEGVAGYSEERPSWGW